MRAQVDMAAYEMQKQLRITEDFARRAARTLGHGGHIRVILGEPLVTGLSQCAAFVFHMFAHVFPELRC